jgi:hypothetical protein
MTQMCMKEDQQLQVICLIYLRGILCLVQQGATISRYVTLVKSKPESSRTPAETQTEESFIQSS